MQNSICMLVLNKIDLLEHTDFNMDGFKDDLNMVNPNVPLFELSCKTEQGVEPFIKWFENEISNSGKKG